MKSKIPYKLPLKFCLTIITLFFGFVLLIPLDSIYEIPVSQDINRFQNIKRMLVLNDLTDDIHGLFDWGKQTVYHHLQDPILDTLLQNTSWGWHQFWTSPRAYPFIAATFYRVQAYSRHVSSIGLERNGSSVFVGITDNRGWYRVGNNSNSVLQCFFRAGVQSHMLTLSEVTDCSIETDNFQKEKESFNSTRGFWDFHYIDYKDPLRAEYQVPHWTPGSSLPTQPQYVSKVRLHRYGLHQSFTFHNQFVPDLTVALVSRNNLIMWSNVDVSYFYDSNSTFHLQDSPHPVLNAFSTIKGSENATTTTIQIDGVPFIVSSSPIQLENLEIFLLIGLPQDPYLFRYYGSRTPAIFFSTAFILFTTFVSYRVAHHIVTRLHSVRVSMKQVSKYKFRQKKLGKASPILEIGTIQQNYHDMIQSLAHYLVGITRKRKGDPTERVRFHLPEDFKVEMNSPQ